MSRIRGIFDVEGLHPVLQGGGEFAGRAAKLLKQKSAEASIGFVDLDRLDQFLLMEKHSGSGAVKVTSREQGRSRGRPATRADGRRVALA